MRRASLILVCVLALFAALGWIATREASLQWVLGRLTLASNGKLHFEGVSGSLLGAIDIARIRYSSREVVVTVDGSSLRFSLLPVLARNDLVIERLTAESVNVRVTLGEEAATPPTDLTLPLAIRIGALEIKRMTVQSGASTLPLSGVRAQFDSDGRQHALRLEHVALPWMTVSASLQLAGAVPFALSGSARLAPTEASRVPETNAKLSGTLLDLQVDLGMQASWISATAGAGVQPFAASPLRTFTADIDRLQLRAIDAALPHADLRGSVRAHTNGENQLAGELTLANDAAGPLSVDKLPLRQGRARFRTDFRQLRLSDLDLQLTRGAPLTGEMTLSSDGLKAQLATRGLDLNVFHASLKPTQLVGNLALMIDRSTQDLKATLADRRFRYEVDLMRQSDLLHVRKALVRADGSSIVMQGKVALTQEFLFTGQATLAQLDPAAFGDFPSARLNGVAEVEGRLRPDWQARVKLKLAQGSWRGQPLSGAVEGTLAEQRFWDSRGELRVGRNEARFTGALGAPADRLEVEFKFDSVQQLVPAWQGSTHGRARLVGKWRYPSLDIEGMGENLRGPQDIRIKSWQVRAVLALEPDAPLRVQAQAKLLTRGAVQADALLLEVEGTARQHRIEASVAGPRLALKTRLTGGMQGLEQWQGRIDVLDVSQPRAVKLEAPTAVSVSGTRVEVGAARLAASGGRFDLEHLSIAPGTFTTRGSFSGVPLALFNAPAPESGVRTTLRLGGDWRIDAGQQLDGFLRVRRESGELFVGTHGAVESQLSEAFLNVSAERNELRGEGRVAAGRGALMRVSFAARAVKEGAAWVVPAVSPITLDAEASLPSLEWLGPFIHPSLVINGKVRATIQGRGTFGNPALEGRIDGSDLAISEPGTGVRLTKGILRAVAAGDRLTLEAFQIHGKEGMLTATGQAALRGERRLQLAFQARQLAVLDRPNWDLNADADGMLGVERGQAKLEARVKVNRALVGLPERGAPSLPEDVVIKGRKKEAATAQKSRVAMDISIDLGNAFRVLTIERATILKQALPIYESKLDARLGGTLRIRSDPGGVPLAVGNIRVVEGVYTFLGKRLEIKRGAFRFDGPLGNPALDILAMNEQFEVKVGASVTGTVLNPRVQLVSDPDVPEQEKLSWLLFGRGGQSTDTSLSGRATSGSGVALFGFQLTEKIYVGY